MNGQKTEKGTRIRKIIDREKKKKKGRLMEK